MRRSTTPSGCSASPSPTTATNPLSRRRRQRRMSERSRVRGLRRRLILDHFAEGADNPMFGPTSTGRYRAHDGPLPGRLRAQRRARSPCSSSPSTSSNRSFRPPRRSTAGAASSSATSATSSSAGAPRPVSSRRISAPSNVANSGIVGVAEEYHRLGRQQARAAFNVHEQGTRATTDLIFLPEGP